MLEAKSKSLYQLDLFQLQVTGSPTEIWPNQKGDILTSITECPEVRLIEGVSVFRLRHCSYITQLCFFLVGFILSDLKPTE
jgi:hypothetical protein